MRAGEEKFRQLLDEAVTLPIRFRLRLLEELQATAGFENEDGLRFTLGSLSEYKRARRRRVQQEPLVRWLASFGAGDVFFDIGANIGGLSLIAARLHGGRTPVIAFEPAFDSFAALVRNILANGLAGVVTPLQVALFDETGVRPFYRSRLGAGSASHAVGEALDHARRPFTPAAIEHVLTFRLDDLVRMLGLPRPTRIKLDVDGVEDKVLAGAVEVLSSSRCEVYTELIEADAADSRVRVVAAFMDRLGYELANVVEHRPPGTFPRVADALFVRR
ncbi:MAG: FkbM family methyltransferase [Acidobacteria bacterium]|nr:FkbM family methyltransferase [Acidobacteriota bacterium]